MGSKENEGKRAAGADKVSYLRVGRILKPQGLHGELKVEITSEDPRRFLDLPRLFFERRDGYMPISVLSVSLREGFAYLKLEGVEDRDGAEALRGIYLSVERSQAIPLPKGRWFIVDLLGASVTDENGQSYGHLVDIHQYGAADIYVLRPEEGLEDLLVPLTDDLLLDVDVENKRIRLHGAAATLRGVWNAL